ncbi:unnamed protein product [Schistosoma spindalis]|nr:unnamed protein product [Schistosoma spindale]
MTCLVLCFTQSNMNMNALECLQFHNFPYIIYRGSDGEYIKPRQIIEHPDGSRTIILGDVSEIPYHYRHGYYCGCGYGFGDAGLLGLAAGRLMWSPFLWFPYFWC